MPSQSLLARQYGGVGRLLFTLSGTPPLVSADTSVVDVIVGSSECCRHRQYRPATNRDLLSERGGSSR